MFFLILPARLRRFVFVLLAVLACACSSPPASRNLTVLHFNDVYQLDPTNGGKTGGAARVATIVARYGGKDPLVLFSGDLLGSSQNGLVLQGSDMVDVMNRLGVDAAVFGNHEFDYGTDVLTKRVRESKFDWIATNLANANTGVPPAGAKPWVIAKHGGMKVGILGLVDDWLDATSAGPEIKYEDFVTAGRRAAKKLKSEGADVVIALTHMFMANDEKLAREVPEIDLILGGHDHDRMNRTVGGTLVWKSGSDWINVGLLTTAVERGKKPSFRAEAVPVTNAIAEEAEIAEFVKKVSEFASPDANETAGETEVELDAREVAVRTREMPIGNLVADIIRARIGAEAAFVNGGGIRSNQIYPPGALLKKNIDNILPFPNKVVGLKVTGAQIKSVLENGVSNVENAAGRFLQVSGMSYAYDPAKPAGQRVTEVSIGGVPLDQDRTYLVATLDFLADGNEGFDALKSAVRVESTGIPVAEVVREFVRKRGIVAPVTDGRIREIPASSRATRARAN